MAENFQNFYVTKLREACDASATTIYVDNPPNFSEGTLVIEFSNSTKHEIIHFTGKSGYGLTGCTRGHEGTTAQSHSAGVDVRQNVTAGILDKIINRAITTENIADNAVTTAKINDGAVTANKIDFTTFNDQLNAMPIASSSFTITSQDISIGLIRVGNLVIAESARELTRFDPATAEITVNITGFEPAHGVNIIFTSVKGGKATMALSKNSEQVGTNKWYFSTEGFSTLSSFRAATIWITNDPWPTN